MALEPQTFENQQQQQQLQTTNESSADNEDLSELETTSKRTLYDKVYEMTEKFATTRPGQFVIERGDRVLRMIENTAKWSLPQDKSEAKLERPLPWLPFLAMIIILRLVRTWCSVGALLIGNGPITAHALVYFIQTRRRKLRAIRMHGLKAIHNREIEADARKSGGSEVGIVGKMQNLLSIAICRPGQYRGQLARRIFVRRGKEQLSVDKEVENDPQSSKRPREDENVDLNLTCVEMLLKYAGENSDDDSDFIPNPDEETNDDESISSGDSSSGNELEDGNNEDFSNNKDKTESNLSQKKNHDISVEIKENVNGRKRPMPTPILEIKTEPLSDNDSSINEQQVQIPKENGPSYGPGETDVATPTPKTNKLIVPTGGQEMQQKSTPGHESAAMVKPAKAVPGVSTTATAVPTKTDELFSFPSNITTVQPDSSSLSASSSSSIASLVTIEDFIVNDNISEPRTPTPTLSSNFENYESSNLISASSSEDIFYSPIGSPPDFNTVFQPVSILKNPIVTQPNQVDAHSTPKTVEDEEIGDIESQPIAAANQKKNIHYQQTQRNQNQNQQHNRNRGRNRR